MDGASEGHLLKAFDVFLRRVHASPKIAHAVLRSDMSEDEARWLIDTYAGEAAVTLALVAPFLRDGTRVLEVGAGIGLVTRLLREQGVDIVGIEPGASGFGFMPEIGAAVLMVEPVLADVCVLPIGAENLDPAIHGQFDLIFSANVLEHIADLDGAFGGMSAVLKPGGEMVHLCPNYFLPYEPHFGIPLIPLFPRLTRWVYPKVLTRLPGVWRDLNFITAGRVRRLALRFGLTVRFQRGVLANILRRFDEDSVFRERQGGPAALIGRMIAILRLARAAETIPGEFLSPMVVRLQHAKSA